MKTLKERKVFAGSEIDSIATRIIERLEDVEGILQGNVSNEIMNKVIDEIIDPCIFSMYALQGYNITMKKES